MTNQTPVIECQFGRVFSSSGHVEFYFGDNHSYDANWHLRDIDHSGRGCRCVLFSKIRRREPAGIACLTTYINQDILIKHGHDDFTFHEPIKPIIDGGWIPVKPYTNDDVLIFEYYFQPAAENILNHHERFLPQAEEKKNDSTQN